MLSLTAPKSTSVHPSKQFLGTFQQTQRYTFTVTENPHSTSIVRTRHKSSKPTGNFLPSRSLKRTSQLSLPKDFIQDAVKIKQCQKVNWSWCCEQTCIYLPILPTQTERGEEGHGSPGHSQQLLTAARWHLWHWAFPGLQPCAEQPLSCKPPAHTPGAITPKFSRGPVLQGRAPACLSPSWGHRYSPGGTPSTAQGTPHTASHWSEFLTSHQENQSWYLQALLLQVSDPAHISNTVEKNQQDKGVSALI